MSTITLLINSANAALGNVAEKLQSIALLFLRIYTSYMFFPAGFLKIKNWDTTLFLFEEEYQVPMLSPGFAAVLGTGGELVFPVLLSLGLISRFSAGGLFFVNAIAVISLADIAPAALNQHLLWGMALAVIALWDGGSLSVDNVLKNLKLT